LRPAGTRGTWLGAAGAALALTLAGPVSAASARDVRGDQQWVLDALNAEKAWEVTRGEGVTVAVLDSGVDASVPVLRGKVTLAPDMQSSVFDGTPRTGQHGTAMASVIAGSGRDGGLRGVAPDAAILSVPVIMDDKPDDEEERVEPDDGLGPIGETPLSRGLRYATDQGVELRESSRTSRLATSYIRR
jgi:subtilisin family serine protease